MAGALRIQRSGVSNSAWITWGRCEFSENKSPVSVDKILHCGGKALWRGGGGNAEFETLLLCHTLRIFNHQQSTLMVFG
jgi:hypothetical protein